MPILLRTPHTYSPGHGRPDEIFPMVLITAVTTETVLKRLSVSLQYGAVVEGAWVDSPEAPHTVFVQNTPAVTALNPISSVDPDTGEFVNENTLVEIVPADNEYDQLKASVLVGDGDVGAQVYDVLAREIYEWLITNKALYTGVIL